MICFPPSVFTSHGSVAEPRGKYGDQFLRDVSWDSGYVLSPSALCVWGTDFWMLLSAGKHSFLRLAFYDGRF